jgi:hypothetical protein
MNDFFDPLKNIILDNVRLALMQRIQRDQTMSLPDLVSMAMYAMGIAVGMTIYHWIMYCKHQSLAHIQKLYSMRWAQFGKQRKRLVLTGKYTMNLSPFGRKMTSMKTHFSENFRGILHHILTDLVFTSNDIYDAQEYAVNIYSKMNDYTDETSSEIDDDDDGTDDNVEDNGPKDATKNPRKLKNLLLIQQRTPFLLNKERQIYATILETSQPEDARQDNNTRGISNFTVEIDVFSYETELKEIILFVQELSQRYIRAITVPHVERRYIYSLAEDKESWSKYRFSTTKTFDNLFFDGKDKIVQKIDFFMTQREWYEKNGIPYTLGIGLYGPPGTGKTSFIKALAKYMNRHLVTVPLKYAKTKRVLEESYLESNYDGDTCVPFSQKIMVIEDIDCIGDVVLQRKPKEVITKEDEHDDESSDFSGSEIVRSKPGKERRRSSKQERRKKDTTVVDNVFDAPNAVTLDDLLNLIDGIYETSGRVLVITSNFYDKLDSALVRPGRIDITLRLDNASRHCIGEMYTKYYGKTLDDETLQKIPDRLHSSASIVNIYVSHPNDPELFLQEIMVGI